MSRNSNHKVCRLSFACFGTHVVCCRYIDYCMNRIRMLRHHNITPIMVFDGAMLPAKKKEEARRYQYAIVACIAMRSNLPTL